MQQALPLQQRDGHLAVLTTTLVDHRLQPAVAAARHAHGHRNAHRRAVGAVHPGVVGDGKTQRHAAAVQRVLHHAAVEGLAQAVGGDEAKTLRPAGGHQAGCPLPPNHDKVGALGQLGPGGAQRFDVAVAQGRPHRAGANERRIANDEIGLRPVGLAWVEVAPLQHLRRLVGHRLAGHRVRSGGLAVPARHHPAQRIGHRLLAVVGQHGVAALDVAVVVYHRLGHAGAAVGAYLPLQKTDPQHQFGQRGGALVQLHAAQLLQGDGLAAQV